MKKIKDKTKVGSLIIGIIIGLVLGGIAGFFLHNPITRGEINHGAGENFQHLTDAQISEINSFFESNPSVGDVQSYCSSNRGYCFYYCRNINSSAEICGQIVNYTRMTSPQE